MASLGQVFTDCQRTTASHPKLMKHLLSIYEKSDFDEFITSFTNLMKKSLIYGDRQPAVERTLNFVAKFATMKKGEKSPDAEKEKESQNEEDEEVPEEADMFLVQLMQFLLDSHEANSQAVRFRVCQLINKILNHMGEEAVIDDDLYSSIYDTMLHRLQDKVPAVRVQAVLAVARLQDPRNKECPVIKAYRYHLSMDPNPDVRRAVLTSTAITFQTLPDILERTRDVRDLVRREAYKVISQKVHIRSLTIAQRVRLISEGLKDRSESVRNTVEKSLIQSWLRMVNSSVLDFLSCLDVEASVTEAELVLKTLFRDVPFPDLIDNFGLLKDERIVKHADLRPESALYWRCLSQHLRDQGAEEALDTIIPDLKSFCEYVHEYALTVLNDNGDEQEMAVLLMEREFVTTQLISMTLLYDLSDEVGRRSLDKLVVTLLVSDKISEALVKGLVEVFGKLHPATSRVNQLVEIISEIRDPATSAKTVIKPISHDEQRKNKLQAARIKVRINQVREEIDNCVQSLDFGKAQVYKEELEELEIELSLINLDDMTTEEVQPQVVEELCDPTTLSKCLMIVCNMIENPDITTMTPTLYSLNENLIIPCLRSEDPAVRNQGVKALGLLCLISVDLAKQHLVLFLQISRIDVEQIQLTALHCVVDLLLLYGLDEFTEAAEDINDVNDAANTSLAKDKESKVVEEEEGVIISALCQMMDSENVDVRTHAAEGLCKLLLASRITSSKLLSHLIVMWYNPATEDDSLLRHMLGVFFPLYASYGGSNQESFCSAVLPTLQTLFNAPSRSPLADVDVDDVANFLVSITSPSFLSSEVPEQVNTHDTLVFTLCTDILANPESSWIKVLIRCLNHLHLSPTNYSTLRQVKVLCEKMLKKVRERVCLNGLERFNTTVQNHLKNAPEPNPEEEKEEENVEKETVEPLSETVTFMNETVRKKRMLFNLTSSDLEFFSSEESDGESSPSKKPALSKVANIDENVGLGSPVFTSTQQQERTGSEPAIVKFSTRGQTLGDAEVELSPNIAVDREAGEDKSLKRTKSQGSSSSGETSEEELRTPSKKPCTPRKASPKKQGGQRRTKQQISNPEESSEGEAAVPSKMPRITSVPDSDSSDNEEKTRLSSRLTKTSNRKDNKSSNDEENLGKRTSRNKQGNSSSSSEENRADTGASTKKKSTRSSLTSDTPKDGKQEKLSLNSEKTTSSSALSKTRSTRSSTSSADTPSGNKNTKIKSKLDLPDALKTPDVTDGSPIMRRSARKNSSKSDVSNISKTGKAKSIDTKPSSSSQTSVSSGSESTVRRSRRMGASSQSTDSDVENTPKGRSSRSSRNSSKK